METVDLSLIYLKIAKYKKVKKILLRRYLLWIFTFGYIFPDGLCYTMKKRFKLNQRDLIYYKDLFNIQNAILYGSARDAIHWWKHPVKDGYFTYDYKNRKKFLNWCISELEKKLK